jgi:transmembrane sensor
VLQGRVRLDRAAVPSAPAPPAEELTAGTAAVAEAAGVLVQPRSLQQVQQDLGWREGRLVFDQLTLAEIAREFNRYHRRQLVVDAEIAGLRLGGSFDAYNLDGFVRLLQQGFGVVVRVDGERLLLASR